MKVQVGSTLIHTGFSWEAEMSMHATGAYTCRVLYIFHKILDIFKNKKLFRCNTLSLYVLCYCVLYPTVAVEVIMRS